MVDMVVCHSISGAFRDVSCTVFKKSPFCQAQISGCSDTLFPVGGNRLLSKSFGSLSNKRRWKNHRNFLILSISFYYHNS